MQKPKQPKLKLIDPDQKLTKAVYNRAVKTAEANRPRSDAPDVAMMADALTGGIPNWGLLPPAPQYGAAGFESWYGCYMSIYTAIQYWTATQYYWNLAQAYKVQYDADVSAVT